ncbi:MAG: hypothetical protein HC929_21760 [Leptolyngbyaceae cyanobacterium SM2_5_2]|nr:hypothetical protein [Leptolyngbyaceae cyanobacterium SM2_5_2]
MARWPFGARTYNRTLAKLIPAASSNTKFSGATARIDCQWSTRACRTRGLSASVACNAFFAGKLQLLHHPAHGRATNRYQRFGHELVAEFCQGRTIIHLN